MMDISKSSDHTEPETVTDSQHDQQRRKNKTSNKKQFHGKKRIYEKLREQIEFYFSSSNLAKDRFMNQMIQDDPCELLYLYYMFLLVNIVNFLLLLLLQLFHSQYFLNSTK